MKTYGWIGYRAECQPAPNGGKQTREICAAESKAAVARAAGVKGPHALWNLDETGNREEIGQSLLAPGVIFWLPLNDQWQKDRKWRRA